MCWEKAPENFGTVVSILLMEALTVSICSECTWLLSRRLRGYKPEGGGRVRINGLNRVFGSYELASSRACFRERSKPEIWRRRAVEAKVATEVQGASSSEVAEDKVTESVATLKSSAKSRRIPAAKVTAAIRVLEKARIDSSNFFDIIGGQQSPGNTWMLIFTADKTAYNRSAEGGGYFPVTAVQQFDAKAKTVENGIYLGPIGTLTFSGNIAWENRKLSFTYDSLNLKIGSLGPFTITFGNKEAIPGKEDPFFMLYYADEEIIVAKGRGGGVAFWCRCTNVSKVVK